MSELEITSRSSRFLQRYHDRILTYYQKKCPTLFHICYDPVGTHWKARKAFGFLLGIFMGILFYYFIIVDLELKKYTSRICGATSIILLSFGCASSLQFRCITLLTIPGFCGRAGRDVLKALVVGYIISGPIFNLTFNGKEVMRSFACTGQLTYNLTKTKYDLMFRPFKQSMMSMKENAGMLREKIESVKEVVRPIEEEIEGEDKPGGLEGGGGNKSRAAEPGTAAAGDSNTGTGRPEGETGAAGDAPATTTTSTGQGRGRRQSEAEYYEAKYRKKIRARCERQLEAGSSRCKDAFQHAYDGCAEAVTVALAWAVCWPMKLTFVCNLVQAVGGSSICNPDGKIDVGIGEGYATLKETRDKLRENVKDAKIEFTVDPKPVIAGMESAAQAAKGVMRDFEVRKMLCISLITFIKRCLSLVFIRIILNACKYHSAYLGSIEHDNVYVTPYFRKIDARRRARGSLTLLPLKKLERTKLVDPFELRQTKAERKNIFGQAIKLILEIITASTFVLLDRLLFELLDIIRLNAKLEITQEGEHEMSVVVSGSGLMASVVRSAVRGLNVKRHISNLVTNEACLPRASRLPGWQLFRIYGSFLGVWLLLLCEAYSQRLRRAIASFFYRKREKRRVLYLYNESLRRRVGFLRFARARVKRLARARRLAPEPDLFRTIEERAPRLYGWLSFFEAARPKCVVCGEPEPRTGSQHKPCPNPTCFAVYCPECWRDVGQECLACEAQLTTTDDEHYRTGDEDDEADDD